ncbi:MAG: hypothetical protein WAV48_03140, partial [Candidatus Magasanikiibacteriota bacterium]
MSVENQCVEYKKHSDEWELTRDTVSGEKAIKGRGERHLPRPSGHDEHDYKCYLSRAHWFGATGRTAHGLHGMVLQKPPIKSNSNDALDKILKNVDLSGNSLDQFASDAVWDLLQTNWGGVLVDYPPTPEGMNKADSEARGNRAYLAYYAAESIINWRYEARNNA